MTASSPAPLVVVTNPLAGAAGRLDHALALLGTGGRQVVAVDLSDPLALDEHLRATAGRTIVAAGGDGTLHVLVRHLWHRGALGDTVLGLLPLGTGNDFARTVGIPLDPGAAADVVLSGSPRSLDLLVDESGAVAVNAVHCGVGELAVRRAAPLKPVLGRLSYRVGAVWAGARAPGWQMRVEVDAEILVQERVLFVGIGNGTSIGGGAVLWPRARPDDGLADVVVATAGGPVSRLTAARALRGGEADEAGGVLVGRGREVRIAGEPLPCIADGEMCGARPGRSWRVHPAAWRLMVPTGAE